MKNTEIVLGIVVKADKVKEADVRVKLLTARGIKTVTAVGAGKANAKLKHVVQLFTIAEFSVIGHRITTAHVVGSNHAITRDIKKFYLACAICEVVAQVRGAGFLLTVNALEELCNPNANTRAVFIDYFSRLLLELGYGVEPDEDLNTAYARYLDIKIPNTRHFL